MATDEEILLKVSKLLENFDVSEQKTEKVLREVTEDEMRVLEDVLDDLNPANLPLNDLFSGKMRVVIPFPTTDPDSELGKFAEFFRSQEYDVDWEKGMVYAERDMRTSDDLLGMLTGEPEPKKKIKKISRLFNVETSRKNCSLMA